MRHSSQNLTESHQFSKLTHVRVTDSNKIILVQEVGAGSGVFVLGVNLVGFLEGLEDGLLDCGEEMFHEILVFIC